MISIQFSTDVGDRYEAIRSGELEGLKNKETMGTINEQILKLVAEYEASKVLLSEQEYLLQEEQLKYENKYLQLKEEYLETMKSTEAKEYAKDNLSGRRLALLEIERDIALLKANIHSVEYQLRLKFLQLKGEGGFHPDLQDILEAR